MSREIVLPGESSHSVHSSRKAAVETLERRRTTPEVVMRVLREQARAWGDDETVALWSRCIWRDLPLHRNVTVGRGYSETSALDVLDASPGERLSKTPGEADDYVRKERDSWK